MKRITISTIGIAAVALLALPLSVRTVSAAANGHTCTSNGGSSGCPSGNLYGTDINTADKLQGTLASAHAILQTNALGNPQVDCTDSETAQSSTSNDSSSSFTKFEFDDGTPTTACTTHNIFGNPTATISNVALPTGFTINWGATCVQGKTGCDGTITINSVDVKITLSNGVTCTATGNVTGNVYNKGNANAPVGGASAAHSELDFPGSPVTVSGGGLCGTSGTETATGYIFGTNPSGVDVYLTA